MQDFEVHRLRQKLQDIETEHNRLNHQILKTRETEQFELELLRRRFDGVIRRLEADRIQLEKEQTNYRRQLERAEKRQAKAVDTPPPKDFYKRH